MRKTCLLTAGSLIILFNAVAQTVNLPFNLDRWDTLGVKNFATETYMGRESILLKAGAVITTKNVDFKDGIIEVDMNFPEKRNFPGVAFRMQELSNCEMFYVGPSKSGKPDAARYTPVFNWQQGWQLYYGDGYSKAFTFKFNTWHHLKIDVHGLKAEIYIDDMQTPLFKVSELKREWKSGSIALFGDEGDIHFANAQYTLKTSTTPAAITVPANGSRGMITRWQVSNVVDRSLFEKKYLLTAAMKEKLTWTTQSSDSSGIINFSRFGSLTKTANTMVARVVVESAKDQIKALSFGFSDYATVYLNDKILYHGADNYGSRDYQFLGTMGFFDTLFLPMRKGENELWFVVSENFGGWGVKAKFEDMEMVSMK